MRKRIFILLIAALVLGLLAAACGPQGEVTEPAQIGEEPTEEPAAEEPTEEAMAEEPTEETAAEPTEEMTEEPTEAAMMGPIVVGSKDFTEQLILGSMTVQLLEDAGYEVQDQTGLGGTTVNREALVAGEIDVYWEYTGTALVNFLGVEEVITDANEAYTRAKEADAANGLDWLDPADFNNTYTLMVTQDTVDAGITTISDLAAAINESPADWRLCTNAEFYARPDGFKGVEALYGFQFPENNVIAMDSGLTYQALMDGECEVAMGFATDGRIAAFGFTNLEDDLGFFPNYNPAPVIRQEVVDADPHVADVLNEIGPHLDTATMTELNKRVDIDEEDVATVAHDFLVKSGLLAMEPTYDQPIVVGSKDFTEQLILGSMTVQLLENAGYEVQDQTGLGGTTVNREALVAGEIDVYWEYTGTALVNFLGVEEVITDANEAYTRAKEADAVNGLDWLDPADFNNTYTLMVTQGTVDAGITTISDLAAAINESPNDWRLCTNAEFYARPDGFKGVEELYGFQFPENNVIAMDSGLTYQALMDGECEVAMGFATDGRIAAFGFTNLDDDLGFFPNYNPAPVVRQEVVDADPGIADVLNEIGPHLDTATMTELNKRVDIDEEDVATVAHDFLVRSGLIAMEPTYDQPIVVGSKDFTEQLILGSMTVQLLENAGYEVQDQTGLGGTTVNREALEAGEIDVYWEYTGTALVNFLGVEEVITDANEAYTRAKEADAANGLDWLDPADFNNTYTLMVTQGTVDAGITTISDLAAAINESPADWRLCTNAEFYARPDGFKGVEALYGFQFTENNVIAMDSGLTYQALMDGECEVAMGFATDGRIAAFGFTNLDDDLGFFPNYNPAPVVRQEVVDADPNIGVVLNLLGPTLDTATMTELNKRVDIDEEDVSAVACDHLMTSGLVDACP